ncbi:MAG: hypothetical protein JO293_03305 [Candidatus Eremiobacteraeota bacterium]|nr:hypothetical protein [Candidatus Eremiobacteraeota bacterium]MBV8222363.1 hypothetical protein [Candidatus Eremiobacteraeota bacterium]
MADVSFKTDIRPLFNQTDIDHMEPFGVALDNYEYMSNLVNADAVYDVLHDKTMPPHAPWPDDKITLFRAWIDGGCKP